MPSRNLCKFYGKFNDLIPAGFKFQKLFARNYRQYCWDIKYCDHIRIWQAHGGYVEINDYFSATQNIVNAILKGFEWHNYGDGDKFLGFVINQETLGVEKYVPEIHDPILVHVIWERAGRSDIDIVKEQTRLYKSYRRERLSPELMNAVKMLADKGWIKAI